jgi:hypothetical protein
MMDDQKRVAAMYDVKAWNVDIEDEKSQDEETPKIQKSIIPQNLTEYIVKIAPLAKKGDLQILKTFLTRQKEWKIEVFIDLAWKKIPTKIHISSVEELILWEKNMWG